MLSKISLLQKGVNEILFPHVCELCGHHLPDAYQYICETCLNTRFEVCTFSESNINSEVMLPEGINFLYTMWKFDKGGYIQELLHKLKYNHLKGLGSDLGYQLGKMIIEKTPLSKESDFLVTPVPLHAKKERIRGFNQAGVIGEGVHKYTGFKMIEHGKIVRTKNTKTQTGFTLKKRNENIKNAFSVTQKTSLIGKNCLIVDDVFTTGATTFELAKTMLNAGVNNIVIASVACA